MRGERGGNWQRAAMQAPPCGATRDRPAARRRAVSPPTPRTGSAATLVPLNTRTLRGKSLPITTKLLRAYFNKLIFLK